MITENEQIAYLIDQLPLPLIWHHQQQIMYSNSLFKKLFPRVEDKLISLQDILGQEYFKFLESAVTQAINETFKIDIVLNGTRKTFNVGTFSYPISQSTQLTYFLDLTNESNLKSYWDLHLRVSKATTQLIKEIAERKKAEEKAEALHNELITASRQAGMFDVATSILHNVGNVLNSVMVSINMIYEKINTSHVSHLNDVAELLDKNKDNIADYLTIDQNGIKIIKYLHLIAEQWKQDKEFLLHETNSLKKCVEKINNVITTQNVLDTSGTVIEEVSFVDIVEEALQINSLAIDRQHIELIRDFESQPQVKLDRVKFLQILVCIIKNSIDALQESEKTNKKIILNLTTENDFIICKIIDNGIGIEPSNLVKIFSQGFTTKTNGHGFGLHNCANAISQMKGNLKVESEGINNGATFIITLPLESN